MTPSKRGKHAAVIGGSIAGMLAARVLADHYETVTLIERDALPGQPAPRKGVPQGHHVHALLKSGELILDRLFPGMFDAMLAEGAARIDVAKDIAWYHRDIWKLRYASGVHVFLQSRPFLESHVVRQLHTFSNIVWCNGWSVQDLLTNADKTQVTGLSIRDASGQIVELQTDLVLDASGRGSKTPQWLSALGYAAPNETTVEIDLTYTSRLFQAPADRTNDWKVLIMNPNGPDQRRGGYIFEVEDDRWMVTLAGYVGEKMPQNDAEFIAYTQSLMRPEIYETIRDAQPISEIRHFRFPAELRRHYERLRDFPSGLLVMGDAVCSFDPVFGQGMSSSAKQAEILDNLLSHDDSPSGEEFAHRFYRQIAKMIDTPWLLATSEDLRFAEAQADRPFFMPILHWYTKLLFRLTGKHENVHRAFSRVLMLIAEPITLFHPVIVAQVLREAIAPLPEP